MLSGGRAQAVALDCVRDDLGDLALGHLHVGLVLELGHLAGNTEERDDRAGARIANALDQRIERQRLGRDAGVQLADRTARHRRDQRELVAGVQGSVGRGVLLIDRHHHGHAVCDRAHPIERVAYERSLGEVQLDRGGTRPLTETGEQQHAYLHRVKANRL